MHYNAEIIIRTYVLHVQGGVICVCVCVCVGGGGVSDSSSTVTIVTMIYLLSVFVNETR